MVIVITGSGTATITGDLTVDTFSALKVDSSNNRVHTEQVDSRVHRDPVQTK